MCLSSIFWLPPILRGFSPSDVWRWLWTPSVLRWLWTPSVLRSPSNVWWRFQSSVVDARWWSRKWSSDGILDDTARRDGQRLKKVKKGNSESFYKCSTRKSCSRQLQFELFKQYLSPPCHITSCTGMFECLIKVHSFKL
ncbi:hypothetical protein COOONC_11368 [Cooperia oncophora]